MVQEDRLFIVLLKYRVEYATINNQNDNVEILNFYWSYLLGTPWDSDPAAGIRQQERRTRLPSVGSTEALPRRVWSGARDSEAPERGNECSPEQSDAEPNSSAPAGSRRSQASQGQTSQREVARKEKSAEDDDKPRRKPGRPKGSKNKKTLERERLAAEAAAKGVLPPEKVKRKPGRPKGSKNKATLEREAKEAAEAMKKARDGLDEGWIFPLKL